MPTPNVMRSRSPVVVSASCLISPAEDVSQESQASSGAAHAGLAQDDADIQQKLQQADGVAEREGDVSGVGAMIAAQTELMDTDLETALSQSGSNSSSNSANVESDDCSSSASSSLSSSPRLTSDALLPPDAAVVPAQSPRDTTSSSFPTTTTTAAAAAFSSPSSSTSSSSPPRTSDSGLALAEWQVAHRRVRPTVTSSIFRPFSKFAGTQKSDKHTYNVEVELKYVDMAESFCCGYLKIEGLTANLPSITTYFEGELIGTRYSFHTGRPSWGAGEKTDLTHWSRFAAFAPLKAAVKAHRHHDPDFARRDTVFMRWKEQFLVPDHRQKDLEGASFDGFYYIAFDQRRATIDGIYFHNNSEKFQRLELAHQPQPWRPGSFEFL